MISHCYLSQHLIIACICIFSIGVWSESKASKIHDEVDIEIVEFQQKGSTTMCENGLLANIDHIFLSSILYFKKTPKTSVTSISYQWRNNKHPDFDNLYFMNINHCFGQLPNDMMYCEQVDEFLYKFHLNTIANVLLSEVEIRLTLFVDDHQIHSNTIKLPKICNIQDEVEIKLNAYDQKTSFTKCENGLLAEKDTIFLSSILDLKATSKTSITSVLYQWKNVSHSDFFDFNLININHCEGSTTNEEIYCENVNENVFIIYLKVTANVLLSEVEIRLAIFIEEYPIPIHSQSIKLPKIFDASKIKLTLNGDIVSITNKTFNLTNDDHEIQLCCEDAPVPCHAVLSSGNNVQVKQGQCLNYTASDNEKLFKVGFQVCELEDLAEIFTLTVNSIANISEKKEPEGQLSLTAIIGIALLSITFIIVGIIFYVAFCKKKDQFSPILTENDAQERNGSLENVSVELNESTNEASLNSDSPTVRLMDSDYDAVNKESEIINAKHETHINDIECDSPVLKEPTGRSFGVHKRESETISTKNETNNDDIECDSPTSKEPTDRRFRENISRESEIIFTKTEKHDDDIECDSPTSDEPTNNSFGANIRRRRPFDQ